LKKEKKEEKEKNGSGLPTQKIRARKIHLKGPKKGFFFMCGKKKYYMINLSPKKKTYVKQRKKKARMINQSTKFQPP